MSSGQRRFASQSHNRADKWPWILFSIIASLSLCPFADANVRRGMRKCRAAMLIVYEAKNFFFHQIREFNALYIKGDSKGGQKNDRKII